MACAGEWGDHVTLQAAASAARHALMPRAVVREDRGPAVEPAEPIEGEAAPRGSPSGRDRPFVHRAHGEAAEAPARAGLCSCVVGSEATLGA